MTDCDYGCVLLLGGSGTGKTYGLREILANLQSVKPRPLVYTINAKDSEYVSVAKKKPQVCTFDSIKNIKPNSIVVIEDIITLSTKDEIALRQLLNYYSHHHKLKVFCVSHNIFKTKLYNTISYFHFVVFTSSLGNLNLIKNTFGYFQLEPIVVQNWCRKFKFFAAKKGVYCYFDVTERIFYATNNIAKKEAAKQLGTADSDDSKPDSITQKQNLQSRFDLFFKGRPSGAQASAVFSILINCVNTEHVRSHDLTLGFASASGVKRVSLVDYVDALLNNRQKIPDKNLQTVHNYISSHCKIPEIFMLNKHFVQKK